MSNLTATWFDRGYAAKNPPDPAYPDGIDLDLSNGASAACEMKLPCPAERCGYWVVRCHTCGFSGLVTTAGRADDPRSVKVACARGNRGFAV